MLVLDQQRHLEPEDHGLRDEHDGHQDQRDLEQEELQALLALGVPQRLRDKKGTLPSVLPSLSGSAIICPMMDGASADGHSTTHGMFHFTMISTHM